MRVRPSIFANTVENESRESRVSNIIFDYSYYFISGAGMKIEVGKFYKTRNGLKVKITRGAYDVGYPWCGKILKLSTYGIWTKAGRYLLSRTGPYDLVSEWPSSKTNPKKLNKKLISGWVNVKIDGTLNFYLTRKDAYGMLTPESVRTARVREVKK